VAGIQLTLNWVFALLIARSDDDATERALAARRIRSSSRKPRRPECGWSKNRAPIVALHGSTLARLRWENWSWLVGSETKPAGEIRFLVGRSIMINTRRCFRH